MQSKRTQRALTLGIVVVRLALMVQRLVSSKMGRGFLGSLSLFLLKSQTCKFSCNFMEKALKRCLWNQWISLCNCSWTVAVRFLNTTLLRWPLLMKHTVVRANCIRRACPSVHMLLVCFVHAIIFYYCGDFDCVIIILWSENVMELREYDMAYAFHKTCFIDGN